MGNASSTRAAGVALQDAVEHVVALLPLPSYLTSQASAGAPSAQRASIA